MLWADLLLSTITRGHHFISFPHFIKSNRAFDCKHFDPLDTMCVQWWFRLSDFMTPGGTYWVSIGRLLGPFQRGARLLLKMIYFKHIIFQNYLLISNISTCNKNLLIYIRRDTFLWIMLSPLIDTPIRLCGLCGFFNCIKNFKFFKF